MKISEPEILDPCTLIISGIEPGTNITVSQNQNIHDTTILHYIENCQHTHVELTLHGKYNDEYFISASKYGTVFSQSVFAIAPGTTHYYYPVFATEQSIDY